VSFTWTPAVVVVPPRRSRSHWDGFSSDERCWPFREYPPASWRRYLSFMESPRGTVRSSARLVPERGGDVNLWCNLVYWGGGASEKNESNSYFVTSISGPECWESTIMESGRAGTFDEPSETTVNGNLLLTSAT